MSTDKDVPCYGCERRNAHCHSSCEDYKAFKQEREKELEVIRKHNEEERMFFDVQRRSIMRNKRDVNLNKQRARKG